MYFGMKADKTGINAFDTHVSVHHDTVYENDQQDATV